MTANHQLITKWHAALIRLEVIQAAKAWPLIEQAEADYHAASQAMTARMVAG